MKQVTVLFLLLQLLAFPAFSQQYKYHIVQQGESLEDIAQKYHISVETIYKYNPDARSGISPSNKLVVPLQREKESDPVEFKEHRVKRKETLFSLSQQYQVEIEDIRRYNKHLYSEELRRGERIRIPIFKSAEKQDTETSQSNPLDLSTKEHVVLPKETWFGISRKYNITIEDLKRLNPAIDTLHPGMVLKVSNGNTAKVVEVDGDLFRYYLVKPKETVHSLTQRFGISRDSLVSLNPALADGLKSGMVLKIPNIESRVPTAYDEEGLIHLERRLTNKEPKDLVVMLPFNLQKIEKTDSTDNSGEVIRRDPVLQLSLDFYSGVLMAVDSAKTLGLSTNVSFYDTERSSEKVRSILYSNDFNHVEAVIGPLMRETAAVATRELAAKGIPVVSPLAKVEGNTNENYLQTRPTDEMLTDAMISYLSQLSEGKNLVIIADASAGSKKRELMSAFPTARIVNPASEPKNGSYVNAAALSSNLVEGQPNLIVLESEKIEVLVDAVSNLNLLSDKYPITLFTTNKDVFFDNDNISNSYLGRLNLHFPSVSRNFSFDPDNTFEQEYLKKFGVQPSAYAVRGFDLTYDILLRLGSADDLYTSLREEGTTQYIENKFDYEVRPEGGFQNKAVYILALDKDMNLKTVW